MKTYELGGYLMTFIFKELFYQTTGGDFFLFAQIRELFYKTPRDALDD
jgi:hypothetical protein